MPTLRDLRIGRLYLPSIEDPITEQLGSEVTSVGESSAVGQRRAKGFTLNFIVHGYDDQVPTPVGNRMRRQLRSMIQNVTLRTAGLYMNFTPDPDRNGWLVIGEAELADADGGVTFGSYKLSISQAFLVAQIRSHREGYRVTLTDRRLTTSPIDTLGQIINTSAWFAGQNALALTFMPVGASDVAIIDGPVVIGSRASEEGVVPVIAGRSDGDVVSFERGEASFTKGDVVIYDRRGNLGPFAGANYDQTPFITLQNLVANPNFEYDKIGGTAISWATGTPGWFLSSGATAKVVEDALSPAAGSAALQIVTTAASNQQGAAISLGVLPAGTYNASVYVRGGAGGETLRLFAGIVSPGTGDLNQNFTATASYARYSGTFTSDGVTQSFIGVKSQTAAVETFFLAAAQVTSGAALQTYFDGDTVAAGNKYAWGSAAGNSISSQLVDPVYAYGWDEVYGPDWPWLAASSDPPAVCNSQCRCRWDNTAGTTPGYKIDVWDGAKWAEQGKVTVNRRDPAGAGTTVLDTVVSSGLVTWTPDRAVVFVTLQSSTDPLSRERVYLTLQRGWTGPRVEVYNSVGQDGTYGNVGADINFTTAVADTNNTAIAVGGGVATVATAGSGSALFSTGSIGSGTFTGENWVHLLRQGSAYAVTLAAVQAIASKNVYSAGTASAYGTNRNSIQITSITTGGYLSAHLHFHAEATDQTLEAEAIRNAGSGTTSQVADGSASGGQEVKDTQTGETANTILKVGSGLLQAKYRVLARVKVDSPATGSFRAIFGAVLGTPVTQPATALTWIDLGELTAAAAGTNIAVNAWRSSGASGSVYIDRIEMVKVEDRARAACPFDGARDHGQSSLYNSSVLIRRPAR